MHPILHRVMTKPGYRILLAGSLIAGGMSLDYHWQVQEHEVNKKHGQGAAQTPHAALTDYWQRAGSPHPARMATAAIETSKPRLITAIAKVESNGKETAINRKTQAKGAFQIKQKYWKHASPLEHNATPKDVVIQAIQADRILDELYTACNGDINCTLSKYGGDTSKRQWYAKTVLAELESVPR